MATTKHFHVRREESNDSAGNPIYEIQKYIATLTDSKEIEIRDSADNLLQIQPTKNDGGIDSDWSSVDQGIAYFQADNAHEEE